MPRSATVSRTTSYVASPRLRRGGCGGSGQALLLSRVQRHSRLGERLAQGGGAVRVGVGVGDLDREGRGGLGEVAGGTGAQQFAAVDDHDVVAGPLQLAEQVGGDQDRDAEVGVDAADQAQHLVAADRVEAVGGLVEEHQLRVVDQRLGELDALLHAGGVAADGAVALLVQPHVAQGVRGALTGGGRREPGHARHVHDELGGRDVGGQAVVFGHVADALADRAAMGGYVESEHGGGALGGGGESQQNLDQRGLAGSVGAHEPGNSGSDVQGEPVEGGHSGVPLAQAFGRDDSHVNDVSGARSPDRQTWSSILSPPSGLRTPT